MSRQTRANDWEICGVAQIGGAATVGGGAWFFTMRSREAAIHAHPFIFTGYGLGFGGSIGGAVLPSPIDIVQGAKPNLYTKIRVDMAFSIDDLNCSGGRLSTMGAGFAIGGGVVVVSAFNFSRVMFNSQETYGFTAGVGASAMVVAGIWKAL